MWQKLDTLIERTPISWTFGVLIGAAVTCALSLLNLLN
jgi:hypothetical protein